MNFGKGGQNIVQAGNNNPNVFKGAGNIFGSILDMKLWKQKQDYLHQNRKDLETHKAGVRVASNYAEGMLAPQMWGQWHDYANKTHEQHFKETGEWHPSYDEKSMSPKDYLHPTLQGHVEKYGIVTSKQGPMPGAPTRGEIFNRTRGDGGNTPVESKTENKVDTSSAVASSPVRGFNPEENDIQSALHQNNATNYFPFESTAGSSGKFSPTKFDNEQPVFSELDAEDIRAENKKTPFDTRAGYKERTSHLTDGINDGTGGNK
jgi:hypothetical protein